MARSKIKTWDNRKRASVHGHYKTWTRRVRWYEDDNSVMLKFEDGVALYCKVYCLPTDAQSDYDKFRRGESVEVWLGGQKTTTVPA